MITLPKSEYEKILAHAVNNLPEEACGLIAGRIEGSDKHIEKVYLLTNIDHSNEHFSLDPKEQLAAIKDMRANGLSPLGNWHRRQTPCLRFKGKLLDSFAHGPRTSGAQFLPYRGRCRHQRRSRNRLKISVQRCLWGSSEIPALEALFYGGNFFIFVWLILRLSEGEKKDVQSRF